MLIPQLRKAWVREGNLSNHVLVSIVRLTVETNLVTSKNLLGIDVHEALPSSHACLAFVSIVSLVTIAVFPVSNSLNPCVMCISAEIDASNIGLCILYVPVCIRFIYYTSPCYAINFLI